MLKLIEFTNKFRVKDILAMSQNGNFEVGSAIYKDKHGRKMYTYFDHRYLEYRTELA